MKKIFPAILLGLLTLSMASCAMAKATPGAVFESAAAPSFDDEGFHVSNFSSEVEAIPGEPSSSSSGFGGTAAAVERMVIKNAELSVVVPDPVAKMAEIRSLAEEMGGFVVSSNVWQTTYGTSQVSINQAQVTIRVPSDRLDEALQAIKEEVTEIRSENVSGQDVTEEYTDLESRLTNLEAAETQLREIMASATETEDVLRVFEDLRQVREEIEVIKGRMRYFEESARLSSVHVDLIPDEAAQPLQIGGWQPTGTAKDAFEDLVHALQFLGDLAIRLLICVLPILLILGLPIYFVIRAILRRRAAKKAALEEV